MVVEVPGSPSHLLDQLAVDGGWTILTAFLVFFMQCGFAMLEAGATRAKNTKNILLKNVLNAGLGCITWWAVGYAFAFGHHDATANGFIGLYDFFLSSNKNHGFFFFQWTFAATSTSIFSGALAERTQFTSYLWSVVFASAWIYPVSCHWIWSSDGWLHQLGSNGMLDFAGGGVVHMLGGGIGLVGAFVVGPREGRFSREYRSKILGRQKPIEIQGHSSPFVALGSFILFFGWFGFNTGSTLALVEQKYLISGRVGVNTALASASACVTGLVFIRFTTKQYNFYDCLNALLAGTVAITPACAFIPTWSSVLLGAGSAIVYQASSELLLLFHIDDPLNTAPVHFFSGAWGLTFLALFARKSYIEAVIDRPTDVYGLFFGGGTEQLGIQLLGMTCITLWVCLWAFPFFYVLHYFKLLRTDHDTEVAGLDNTNHGGTAYPDFTSFPNAQS